MQGAARIDPSVYRTGASIIVLCVIVDLLLIHSLSICFAFSLIADAILLYNATSDRSHLVERISQAVGDASERSSKNSEKARHALNDDTFKDSIARAAPIHPDSVWNEAVSEYEIKKEI